MNRILIFDGEENMRGIPGDIAEHSGFGLFDAADGSSSNASGQTRLTVACR
jgi:hypothetical protein